MVKLKKSEIGVWKIVEVKGHRKHQKEKLKHIHEELPAKPKRQKNVNDYNAIFVTWITYTYAMWILLQHALFLCVMLFCFMYATSS